MTATSPLLPRALRPLAVLSLALALGSPATASPLCPRPLVVPLAPIGISVVVNGAQIGGLYPDLLTTIHRKTDCQFATQLVPRARLEAMFEAGKADVLMPATRTPRRDRYGEFVPMIDTRATLISFDHDRAPVRDVEELLRRRELRVALVRGNDYGETYLKLVDELSKQHRAYLEVDAQAVARLLQAGIADITIMTPTSFTAALKENPRLQGMMDKLRLEALDELPWHEGGVYVSRKLGATQRAALIAQFRAAYKANAAWEQFKRYYPPKVIAISARPR